MVSKKFKLIFALAALIQTASYAQDSTSTSTSTQDTTHPSTPTTTPASTMPMTAPAPTTPMSSSTTTSPSSSGMSTSSATTTSTSSTDASWAYDSSKVSTKSMPQYNEFVNYQNPYPPKPRSMWELSVSGGNAIVIGDRPILGKKQPNGGGSYIGGGAIGISARVPISHVFSGRLGYMGSLQKIPGYTGSSPTQYIPFTSNVTHMLSADLIASLNTISSHRGNPKVNYYLFVGYSIATTQIAAGEKGWLKIKGPALTKVIASQRNDLVTTFHKDKGTGQDNQAVYNNIDFGGGMSFRISPKFNIGFEERISSSLTGVDFLDGYVNKPGYGFGGDKMAYSLIKLNFNLGNSATHVEPLWWINPNNYIYNEVATPKHMKLPPVVLPDADGDGVTDQFDMEPNTPAGCAVDVHGVSLDTDGDGVPDCRDKEKLTPQNCFPVNADGVGTCPEPACCKALDSLKTQSTCSLGSLPSVQFKAGSATLNATAKSLLDNVAQQLTANPNCRVKLVGYGASDKKAQQLSWDHVNAVKTYLTEKQGISESRVIFTYGMEGSGTSVDLVPTTEEGPNTVPAPHPNLKK